MQVKLPLRYCNHLDINSISRHMEYHIQGLEYGQGEREERHRAEASDQEPDRLHADSSMTQSRRRRQDVYETAHLEL